MSFHFLWYVQRHINPHDLRVMALLLTGENDRLSIKRVEPVRGCLITQALWNGPP
jgi:hypothetical protein